jgi:hypothetical protein
MQLRILSVGLVAALCSTSGASLRAQSPRDDVAKAEAAFVDARTKGDKTAYARLLADEFTWTNRSGSIISKTQSVDGLSPAANPETSKDIRVFGDAAVVTGLAKVTQDGKPQSVRFVRVWVKRGPSWQAVLHQGTAITQ